MLVTMDIKALNFYFLIIVVFMLGIVTSGFCLPDCSCSDYDRLMSCIHLERYMQALLEPDKRVEWVEKLILQSTVINVSLITYCQL